VIISENMDGFDLVCICAALFIGCDATDPHLQILPSGIQEVSAGKNLVLTCRAQVPNLELMKDMKWIDPLGQDISQDNRVYSEAHPSEAAVSLFIKRLTSSDAGEYKCHAVYAANQQLTSSVTVSIFIGITWSDAPTSQYASLGSDYKLRCKVEANPPANIDWLKESVIVSTVDGQEEKTVNMVKNIVGDRYVIETDGLLLKAVSRTDGGTYTCRARVPQTGELEERDIVLDVQEPPSWVMKPSNVRGIEAEKAELKCQALGRPVPKYTWVDREGNDAAEKEGWILNANTGTLTAYQLERQDAGEYKCIAENNAGRLEAFAQLIVIIRPKVQEFENQTASFGEDNAILKCKASGDPLPKILWRKWSMSEPYVLGGQPDDERIIIEDQIVEAPDYTEGERKWQESWLTINNVKRTDDGLYECQAVNVGGKFFKSGHLTVEFAPTFEDQQITKEWAWDQRTTNLSCLATSIPNATISWWYRDLEIGREDLDKNYDIQGHGPLSILTVSPLAGKYYGHYECKAENIHGVALHEIQLAQAHEPTQIQQAVLDKVTSTTLQFRFVPPSDIGGLPLDAYAVEYKETRHQWNQAKRRVWPIAQSGDYILEDLSPKTTFDLRFGCKNRVGFSPWGAGQQVTMPKRGRPEPPILNTQDYGMPGYISDSGIGQVDSSNKYELSWQIPEDNGIPIDMFLLQYYPVRVEQTGSDSWVRTGDVIKIELQNRGTVRHTLDIPYQDTYVKIGLQAHNELGFSDESILMVRAAGKGIEQEEKEASESPPIQFTASQLPLIPIIGTLLAVLLLLIILIDISCYKINKIGVTNFLCEKTERFNKFDAHNESKKLAGQSLTSTNTLQGFGNGVKENSPLLDSYYPNRVRLSNVNSERNIVSSEEYDV